MAFHRLTVNPAGYDAFPGGYDFINDPAANGDAGVPANADGKKAGGPNDGTYFVGFGEDATSSDANRGFKALAQNTDELDNSMRRPLAVPTRSANTTAVAPVTSILLPDASGVFVAGASSAIPETLQTLFEVLDGNDNEIIDPATGVKCVVTAAVGVPPFALGDGFSLGTVTLTITPAIPTGTVYRTYYGKKSNLRDMPVDTFTVIKVRGAQELPAGFEDFQKMISRYTATNVTALVATLIETPDGVRLAKSNTMGFDVDADGTVGGTHRFFMRKLRDGAAVTMFEVNDDASLGGAAVGRIRMASGYVLEAIGAMLLRDSNVASGAAQGGAFIPLTSSTAANGDKYLRLFEQGTLVGATTRSVFQMINGKWTCTVGDGTASFGDFSGANALQQAVNYFNTTLGAPGDLHIKVKNGTYVINDGNGSLVFGGSQEVTLEGLSIQSTILQLSTTAAAIQGGADGALTLKRMSLTRTGGLVPTISPQDSNIVMDDVQVTNAQVYNRNQGTYGGDPVFPYAGTFRRCVFQSIGLGAPTLLLERSSSDLSINSDYLIEDCLFFVNETNTPAVRIQTPAASGVDALLRSVRFVRTKFSLGSSTVSANNPVGRSCVLDFVDNGSVYGTVSGGLSISRISFKDCDVFAGGSKNSDATVQVFHFQTPGMPVGEIAIDGGNWMVLKNNPSLATFIIAGGSVGSLTGAPKSVSLRNMTLGWSAQADFSGSGRTTATTYGRLPAYLTPPASVADHSAFYIAAERVELKNIRIVGACGYSANAELWVDASEELDVDKVVVALGAAGSPGTAPNFRTKFTPSNGDSGGAVPGAARVVSRVTVTSTIIDGTNGQGVIVVIPFGELTVEKCFVNTMFGPSGSGCISLPMTDPHYGNLTAAELTGLSVLNNRLFNGVNGFALIHTGAAGLTTSVPDLTVQGNITEGHGESGINISCLDSTVQCSLPRLLVHGNKAKGCTGYQIAIFPSAFAGEAPSVVGNSVVSTSASDLFAIGTLRNSGNNPAFTVQGNSCMAGAAFGPLGVRLVNGAAFPTDESSGTGLQIGIRGIEVGWIINASVNYREFNSAAGTLRMIQNYAGLFKL